MDFVKAKKSQAKARVALIGPTGAGKTYSALVMAEGMRKAMGGAKVVVIDTEHNSAAKYSDRFDFMVPSEPMPDHAPASYVAAIRACENAGFDIIIVDSLSHAWVGRGGALEMKDRFAANSKSGNSFTAWAKVTPEHNALMEALISCKAHVIATMRSKMSYVQEQDDRGRTKIRKVGLAPVQRDGVEYEFDLIGDIARDHKMTIDKTRWSDIDQFYDVVTEDFGKSLIGWLSDGVPEMEPIPTAKEVLRDFIKGSPGFDFDAWVQEVAVGTLSVDPDPKKWSMADFEKAVAHLENAPSKSKGQSKKGKIAIN